MSPCLRFFALALGATLAAAAGCGDDPEPNRSDGAAIAADAGDEDDEELVPCGADYPVFSNGMTAKADDLTVNLLSVSPEPPRQQTPNNWLLEVVDATGAPVSGAEIDAPDSYMPAHGHHGRTQPKVVAQTQPGRVQLSAIDFKMRGPWQVNFDVVSGGKSTLATFQICVQ
jgi:hypothetical protein